MINLKRPYLTFCYAAVTLCTLFALSPSRASDPDIECARLCFRINDIFGPLLAFDPECESKTSSACDPESELVDKCLSYPCGDFSECISPTIYEYQPFSDIESYLDSKDTAIFRSECSDELGQEALKLWTGAEQKHTNPFLKAVCIYKQLEVTREASQKFHLLDRFAAQLELTSNALVESPKLALKAKMLAAFETTKIRSMARNFKFGSDQQESAARVSHLINRSAELWEAAAQQSENPKIPAWYLYLLLPGQQINEHDESDLYISDLCILDIHARCNIKQPSFADEFRTMFESAEDYEKRQIAEAPVNEQIRLSFKTLCLFRAASFSLWHYRLSSTQKPGISFLGSESDELQEMFRRSAMSASSIVDLMVKQDDPQAKFDLCLISAEQKAKAFRQGKTVLDFDGNANMSNQAKKIFNTERNNSKSFLEKMYKEALIYADQVPYSYENRVAMERAHTGIAMLTDDEQEKRKRMTTAFELTRITKEELAPYTKPREIYSFGIEKGYLISNLGNKVRIQEVSQ